MLIQALTISYSNNTIFIIQVIIYLGTKLLYFFHVLEIIINIFFFFKYIIYIKEVVVIKVVIICRYASKFDAFLYKRDIVIY